MMGYFILKEWFSSGKGRGVGRKKLKKVLAS
jgi:hypothetical protein